MESNHRAIEANFWLGEWLIQPRSNRITKNGRSTKVEPKVMEVLIYLARQAGETVTREQLLETLWANTFVTEDALNRSISKLRKVFDDDPKNPSVIETIPKIGYRLIAPVSAEGPKANGINSHIQNLQSATLLDSPLSTSGAQSVRHRPLEIALYVALALLVIAGGSWLAWRLIHRPVSEPPRTAVRIVPLTSFAGHEVFPSFSPDASRVAFAWAGEAHNNWDIYVKQTDSETTIRLTNNPARDQNPTWSPDGRTIASVRTLENEKAVYAIPALGGPERKLTSCSIASEPDIAWSADGKTLALTDRGNARSPHTIFLLAVDLLERRLLTSPPENFVGDGDLAFSPDGRTLAFARSSALGVEDIYLLSMQGGEPKRITFDNLKIHGIIWMPDGRSIVYSSNRGGSFSLWKVSADGGAPQWMAAGGENAEEPTISAKGDQLVYEKWNSDTNIWQINLSRPNQIAPSSIIASTQWDWNPQFSPDGNRIAFISDRSGAAEVWVCDVGGQNAARLTSFNGPYTSTPRWSPDGRLIAFDTPAQGNFDIYVIDTRDGQLRRLTTESSEERAASWSRDGRWIYFASNRSGSWQVWKAPSQGGEPLEVTRDGGFAALESPDGNWLYYTKQDAPGLWRRRVEGGDEGLVLSRLNPVDWNNWAVTGKGIYFVDRAVPDRPELALFDPGAGSTVSLGPLRRFLYKSGLTISPDGATLLYTQIDKSETDLILVENFR